jgi:hypothetical protein
MIEIILYIVKIIWYYIMLKTIHKSTFRFLTVVAILLNVIAFLNGLWINILFWRGDRLIILNKSDEFKKFKLNHDKSRYFYFILLLESNRSLGLIIILVVGSIWCFSLIFSCFFVYTLLEWANKPPGIKSVL